jgi:gas vesicle protein
MFSLLKLLLSPKTLLGMAVGGAAAWFADPDKGAERRAQAVDMLKDRSGRAQPSRIDSSTSAEPTLWTPSETSATAV